MLKSVAEGDTKVLHFDFCILILSEAKYANNQETKSGNFGKCGR